MKSNVTLMLTASALLLAWGGGQVARAQNTAPITAAAQNEEAEAKLLSVGQTGPDFTLPIVHGGEVTLANTLAFNKAALLCFFSVKPERGGADMARVRKLQEALEGKGLATIAINPTDRLREVTKFVEAESISFPVAIDGKETNSAVTGVYRARTLPPFYLLDPAGKVLFRSVGYKEEALRAALEKAGVK